MSPLARRLVWVLALVGLGASLTSLYVHYQMLTHPGYTSFCDINQTFSCQQAYLSRYGTFLGVPVALLGAIWFGAVFVMAFAAAAGPERLRESVPAYLFVWCTIGLAVILYLGYAAFFLLNAVCVMCLTTYAAVIGLFIVSGLVNAMPPMMSLPRRVFGDLRSLSSRPAVLLVVLLFSAGAVSALAFFPREEALKALGARQVAQQAQQPATADQRSEFERYYESLPRTTIPVPSDGAAVVIVKFTDMQCPSCGQSFFANRPILSKYQSQYPGAVKYVVKDYPLQPDCNSNVPRPIHSAACEAAAAVRMARAGSKGDVLEEWFYSHQPQMSPASVREAAVAVGGVQDFDQQYPRVVEQIKADVGLGRLLNVRSTPTFFINGVKIEAPTPQMFDMAIALELKKAGRIK
ncbi:MAG TPA: vitamin K epoxide reductase family protein [Vicinamibacterales bacterium]|jgi:uncharacterized membrane protein/protein-disulfide isomerase